MDFYKNVRILEDKLSDILAADNLLFKLSTDRYPITLTVSQNQSPEAQMELYATTDGNISAQDSVLQFIFKLDALEIRTDSRFVISDALMNKIKGVAKKIHYSYLQAYFAERRNADRIELYGSPDDDEERNDESDEVLECPDTDSDDDSVFDEFFTGDGAALEEPDDE